MDETSKDKIKGCLMSHHDLGKRGFLGIRWGYWAFRWDMFWLKQQISYPILFRLKWYFHKVRFKCYVKNQNMYLKDRITGKTKKIGVLV